MKLWKIIVGILGTIGALFAASSKREIGNLKRKLTNSKKKTQKMEKVFDEDNADEALDFLRKFANK